MVTQAQRKVQSSKETRKSANNMESISSLTPEISLRWVPDESCRPKVDEAPVFYPTMEEFQDALSYIAKIRPIAQLYGICRIVPPPYWAPPCLLKEKQLWENSKFSTRVQPIELLQKREPMWKKYIGRKRKRGRQAKLGTSKRARNSVSEANGCLEYDKFGFSSGPDFTLSDFEIYSNHFKESYFGMKDAKGDNEATKIESKNRWEPSVDDIEGEYWRIIEADNMEDVEVLYGADLETGPFGSGFPKKSSKLSESTLNPYAVSDWNLNNSPRLPGSVLFYEKSDISGVLVPWLYVGMCFSSFCWHVEDHHLYSVNYLHWGAPKVWYGVPGTHALALEAAMKKHLSDLFEEVPGLLNELVTQLSPSILKSEGVPVHRVVQHAGEFVITFPRAYHSGFNCGFNCAEAVNIAPFDWLEYGQGAVELYSEQHRKSSVSHDKLLLTSANNAVQALMELAIPGNETSENLRLKRLCGKDGVLTKAFKRRVQMEEERMSHLPTDMRLRKMDSDFDITDEKDCVTCLYDLYLSAAGCDCSQSRYSCLRHSKSLCSCGVVHRFVLQRYTINELNTLVRALEGDLDAINEWKDIYSKFVNTNEVKVEDFSCMVLRKERDGKLHTGDGDHEKEGANAAKLKHSCSSRGRTKKQLNDPLHTSTDIDYKVGGNAAKPKADHLTRERGKKNALSFSEPVSVKNNDKMLHTGDGDGDRGGEDTATLNPCHSARRRCNVKLNGALSIPESVSVPHDNEVQSQDAGISSAIEGKRLFECGQMQKQPHLGSDAHQVDDYSMKLSLSNQDYRLKTSTPHVELLSLGSFVHSENWCSKNFIFTKGFKSRTKYFNVHDPTKLGFYISEVLDSGVLGPLFKVSLEECPSESFTNFSAASCWESVLEKLNIEILKYSHLGVPGLPPLQPSNSINGLEMFGFLTPQIVQDIEALDKNHECKEYWYYKQVSPASEGKFSRGLSSSLTEANAAAVFNIDLTRQDGDNPCRAGVDYSLEEMQLKALELLKKASTHELDTMHKVFSSESLNDEWRKRFLAMIEDIHKKM